MEHALAKTTLFSGFLSTMLLTFLAFSLSYAANPCAIVVKCDSSVYDVVVYVDEMPHYAAFNLGFFSVCRCNYK